MGAVGKYAEYDSDPRSSHSLIVSLAPAGAAVLEFGCATGSCL